MIAGPPEGSPVEEPSAGQRLPGPERRRQLLAVGRQVFAESGFHDTSMAQVAARAGVTKPVLYQHFESKRALYGAILTAVGDELSERVLGAAVAAASPREQVTEGVSAALQFAIDSPYGFQVLWAACSSTDDEWRELGQRWRNSLAEQVAGLIKVDGMADAHRRALAYGVVGLVESMMMAWLTAAEPDLDAAQLRTDLVDLAWSGLRGLG